MRGGAGGFHGQPPPCYFRRPSGAAFIARADGRVKTRASFPKAAKDGTIALRIPTRFKQKGKMTLDETDRLILRALQREGRLTSQELADKIGLSASQCARRRQRLEEDGIISGYRATIDVAKAGAAIIALIRIVMSAHSKENAATFRRLVETTPEILDAWVLTGEADYLLRVAVADLASLNEFVQDVLLPQPIVARVQSQIVLSELKSNGPIPIHSHRS
jgi:DNA-binding Lrp family transcriptional regulator